MLLLELVFAPVAVAIAVQTVLWLAGAKKAVVLMGGVQIVTALLLIFTQHSQQGDRLGFSSGFELGLWIVLWEGVASLIIASAALLLAGGKKEKAD